MKTVVACLFACVVAAHSTQLLAQASPTDAAAPKVATAVTTPPEDATGLTPADADESAQAQAAEPSPDTEAADAEPVSEKHDQGASLLVNELHKVESERSGYSRLMPWLTVGVGAAMAVGGTAVGAGYVFSCENGCSTPAWIGILVATGTFVATLGAIWVVRADADVRELDSRRYHLEQEIERIRVSSRLPTRFDNQGNQLISMRFALN